MLTPLLDYQIWCLIESDMLIIFVGILSGAKFPRLRVRTNADNGSRYFHCQQNAISLKEQQLNKDHRKKMGITKTDKNKSYCKR